jgi:hypothetical protein
MIYKFIGKHLLPSNVALLTEFYMLVVNERKIKIFYFLHFKKIINYKKIVPKKIGKKFS